MRGKRGGACPAAGSRESPLDQSILPPAKVTCESNERAVGTSNSLRAFCAFRTEGGFAWCGAACLHCRGPMGTEDGGGNHEVDDKTNCPDRGGDRAVPFGGRCRHAR